MKIKTAELTGAALDWAVATALGRGPQYNMESHGRTWYEWWLAAPGYEYEPMPSYSTKWAHGGPIIEREMLTVGWVGDTWAAVVGLVEHKQIGPTPLTAAMRCYVASELGDEVEIPEELV